MAAMTRKEKKAIRKSRQLRASKIRKYRWTLSERQNHRCCYCGIRFVEGHRRYKCTLEHLYPKGHPRRHHQDFMVVACMRCNGNRPWDISLEEYWFDVQTKVFNGAYHGGVVHPDYLALRFKMGSAIEAPETEDSREWKNSLM